ncbi:hypothetical protein M3Y98_01192300 [Aphelenchoides besseyi]|nr:hypothetical protein M3Y98_01192300 [Aphelenchoides besseyi]
MTTQHPYINLVPLNDGFLTKDTKKSIPLDSEFVPMHNGLKYEDKVEKLAESAVQPTTSKLASPKPSNMQQQPPQPATPKPSDTQQTAQLATPKPSNTNQQSPAPVEKKVEEAANKNKLKNSDFYVFGQDESKDEDEKKDDKKKRLTLDRTQDDKA